jgi:NTP pyrophosphatase (non-canonical NTP hydrolase)
MKPKSEGHTLSKVQIDHHGRDRYPTIPAQYRKVIDELGELGEALMEILSKFPSDIGASQKIRQEFGDVGLALYELGNKMGLDLIYCMSEVVGSDTRDFREPT